MADGLSMSLSFGKMGKERPNRDSLKRERFRIALMGDFSGRAARGEIETGAALAGRRAIRLDIDTVERVIEGFATTLVLPVGKDGAGIEVPLRNLDDLHPDELFSNVELFSSLATLKRSLKAGATSDRARTQLSAWGKEFGRKVQPPKKSSRGNKVPANVKLSEFQKLIGGSGQVVEASAADELIARIVGPHVSALPDPDVPALSKAVDEALSDAMRLVLHHPDFQSVEAQWRMLDLIARTIETDDKFEVILYDITAEEIAADLASVEDLTESGLYGLLAEGTPDGRGNFSALFGLYTFEEVPPHAELLGRIGRLAAHIDAPFISAIAPGFLETPKIDRHPLVVEAWDGLRAMPEANHLMLVTPRFLLRRPYGRKSDPISEFDFEEFTEAEGLSGMLWANGAVLVMILMAQSWRTYGANLKLGAIMSLGQQPYHFVNDRWGDQIQLPCTDRNMTQTKAKSVIERGYCPILTVKGRDEVRLAAFVSLAGRIVLGPWSKAPPPPESPPSEAPDWSASSRKAQPSSADSDDFDLLASDEGGDSDLDLGGSDADDDGDADLDALLAGLESDEDSGDSSDLDALLASFGDDTGDSDGDEMDPELAALLADL